MLKKNFTDNVHEQYTVLVQMLNNIFSFIIKKKISHAESVSNPPPAFYSVDVKTDTFLMRKYIVLGLVYNSFALYITGVSVKKNRKSLN